MPIEFDSHVSEVKVKKTENINNALEICRAKAEGYALEYLTDKLSSPSGQLRNSTKATVEGKEVILKAGTSYAVYVEMGTGAENVPGGTTKRKWVYPVNENGKISFRTAYPQRPKPFIKPAIADHISEYEMIIAEELNK